MSNDIFSKYVNKDQEKIKQKGRKKLSSFPGHNGIKSIRYSYIFFWGGSKNSKIQKKITVPAENTYYIRKSKAKVHIFWEDHKYLTKSQILFEIT